MVGESAYFLYNLEFLCPFSQNAGESRVGSDWIS